jgi:uncharacterized protein (TIGR03083 family)
MDKSEIWSAVHAERKALVADLSAIDPADWDRTSLCTDWTVRDVVAHMAATAALSPARFFPKLIGSGFSLTRMQARDIAATRGPSPNDTLDALNRVVDASGGPPGPVQTNLGETLVHAEDIRRSLGRTHEYPTDALATVGEFYAGSNLIIGGKRRVAGITLRAADASWTVGAGPELSGPLLALVMAAAGRGRAYADQLDGPAKETLLSR